MKKKMKAVFLRNVCVGLFAVGVIMPGAAHAVCTGGVEGQLEYETVANVYRYCDGTDWVNLTSGGGGSSALDDITAADGTNTISNTTNGQIWNWALTSAGAAMTFGESTASSGGSDDQYIVQASTLSSSTAIPLYLQNLGAGDSFRVDDVASDTTPFVIDASGNVGIGIENPTVPLDVVGNVKITGNQIITGSFTGILNSSGTASYFTSGFDTLISMRDSDGYVSIGVATPNEQLTVGGVLSLLETTAPSATSAHGKLYVKSSDSKLYFMDDSGSETDLTAGGGGGATDIDGLSDAVHDASNFNLFLTHEGGSIGSNDDYNTGIGVNALDSLNNTTGIQNTALGYSALTANNSGDYNTAVGAYTLDSVTSGRWNVGVGIYAGQSVSTANSKALDHHQE